MKTGGFSLILTKKKQQQQHEYHKIRNDPNVVSYNYLVKTRLTLHFLFTNYLKFILVSVSQFLVKYLTNLHWHFVQNLHEINFSKFIDKLV